MNNKKGILIGVIGLLVLTGSVVAGYLYIKSKTGGQPSNTSVFPKNPKKGDLGYHETNSVETVGGNGVYKAIFGRIESTNMYVNTNGKSSRFLLNENEIVIQCTNEPLENTIKFDLHKVQEVKVTNYQKLYGVIPTGTTIFFLTTGTEDSLRVITLVVPLFVCTKDI